MERRITQVFSARQQPRFLKRVCAYVRVSTHHPEQLGSLQNQTEYYERAIKANPFYEYCGIFSDAGISGAKTNRPGFLAMMEKARAGEINIIITKSISRFARNTVFLLQSIRELKALGVEVIFEEQHINISGSEGEMLLTLLASIAEEERRSVCGNIQWAMRKKFRRGEVMVDTGRLLGFDKDQNGNLIINKAEAKIVRDIFKRYLVGVAAYSIAAEFNKGGVPTDTGKPWSSEKILRIISNEKYKGDCLLQKSYIAENGKQKLNCGQLDQYYIKNNHPAVVSKREWARAQEVRNSRKPKEYPFTSQLHCPYCKATLIRVLQEGGKRCDWICSTYMHHTKEACMGIRVPEEKLLAMGPITEPVIVEEVGYEKKRSEKSFRLLPYEENR